MNLLCRIVGHDWRWSSPSGWERTCRRCGATDVLEAQDWHRTDSTAVYRKPRPEPLPDPIKTEMEREDR